MKSRDGVTDDDDEEEEEEEEGGDDSDDEGDTRSSAHCRNALAMSACSEPSSTHDSEHAITVLDDDDSEDGRGETDDEADDNDGDDDGDDE